MNSYYIHLLNLYLKTSSCYTFQKHIPYLIIDLVIQKNLSYKLLQISKLEIIYRLSICVITWGHRVRRKLNDHLLFSCWHSVTNFQI